MSNLKRGLSTCCTECRRDKESGENSSHWKGGITPETNKIRNSLEYKKWRNEVFSRDNYICQCCGAKGGKLNAHHIVNFSNNDELRFDIKNGITLCEKCHSVKYEGSFHNIYGTKNNTMKQLIEYINNSANIYNVC